MEQDTETWEDRNIMEEMDGESGIEVTTRKYHLKKYEKCFVGNEAVDWIIQKNYAKSREDAVDLLNNYVNFGCIKHVTGEHKMEDAGYFYRFAEDFDVEENQARLAEPQNVVLQCKNLDSPIDLWHKYLQEKQYVIFVFYRGHHCAFCKHYLKIWDTFYQNIRFQNGIILGITSQSQGLADIAKVAWDLQIDTLADPKNELANFFNLEITTKKYFKFGLVQSSVVVGTKKEGIIYKYSVVPKFSNFNGAKGRPNPSDVFNLIQNSINGEPLNKIGYGDPISKSWKKLSSLRSSSENSLFKKLSSSSKSTSEEK